MIKVTVNVKDILFSIKPNWHEVKKTNGKRMLRIDKTDGSYEVFEARFSDSMYICASYILLRERYGDKWITENVIDIDLFQTTETIIFKDEAVDTVTLFMLEIN